MPIITNKKSNELNKTLPRPKSASFKNEDKIDIKSNPTEDKSTKEEKSLKKNLNQKSEIKVVKNNSAIIAKRTETEKNSVVSKCPFNSNNVSLQSNVQQTQAKLKNLKTCPFKGINLNSYMDNRVFSDNFHNKSVKGLGCSEHACKGSILKEGLIKIGQLKNKETSKIENLDFLNQYYEAFSQKNSEAHKKRIFQSEEYFKVTGHYDLTFDELEFACRTAWRNASRCIGRINWSKIKLFDGRDCNTTKEMFDLVCEHLKYATNNGNLRSAISVFKQRVDKEHDFRIWNAQVLNYAGYQISETETIGDKAQIEFTKICEKLGWKSKKTEFDILPLILQANGKKPELYEIPEDLIMEVELTHPKYESFKDLKLKWYAVPMVSSLVLDAGGAYYNCVAFNGWYMNTEIGRDLIEPNRFNKLKVIAKVLGLDTNTNLNLWKDEALLELNKAILYSFNKAGVTIVDHHSASESFVKHWENEFRIRGGTPGDWIWINPPLSSHITPIFGMEMLNYIVKPYFEYQEMPNLPKRPIKFKALCKSLLPFIISANKKIKFRTKCLILYASQTGKSKNFSEIVYKVFKNIFNCRLVSINDYDLNNLNNENLILVISSTTGNGDSPTNGKKIEEFMNQIKKNEISTENVQVLSKDYSNTRYSILGFGDSTYCNNFCAFPKLINKFFRTLKLKEIHPIGLADQTKDEEKTAYNWLRETLLASFNEFEPELSIKHDEIEKILNSKDIKKNKVKLRSTPFKGNKALINNHIKNLSNFYEKNLKAFELIEREVIGYQPNNQKILRIKLKAKDCMINYKPGNHIEIFGKNRKEYVDFILSRLNNNANYDEPVKFEIFDENLSSANNELWLSDKKYPIMSIRDALSSYFDITKPLTQDALRMLASQALNKNDREQLELLANDWKTYEEWKSNYPNLVDVLKTFFSVNPDINLLLAELSHMKSRFYSISSSKLCDENEVELTLNVIEYESKIFNSIHYGVCSKYLEEAPIGTIIPCEIKIGNKFTMPEDLSTPILMICAGCGIAPFRSFWLERKKQMDLHKSDNQKFGEFILFYGCREQEKDFLYKNELIALKEKNVFTEFYTAFSRDPNNHKEYVQDKLNENDKILVELIVNKNAHVYVCGRQLLAGEVFNTLKSILEKSQLFNSLDDIEQLLADMRNNNRYHEDLFNS